MTLPIPLYDALESGDITFSKAKLATVLSFSPEDDDSIEVAENIVEAMKSNRLVADVKAAIQEEGKKIWNPSTAVLESYLHQHQCA